MDFDKDFLLDLFDYNWKFFYKLKNLSEDFILKNKKILEKR